MGVIGVLHTGITVSDLDRSVAFYRDVLGLELVAQWDSAQPYLRRVVGYPDAELRIALLRVPAASGAAGPHIELLEYRQPRGTRPDAGTYHPGNVHVAFVVEDLDATHRALAGRGVRFKSDPVVIDHGRNTGARAVYAFDPDDVTLEFVQPAPAPRPAAGVPSGTGS